MKKVLFVFLLLWIVAPAFADHIKGGFFTYQYKGPGLVDPSKHRYDVTLTVYMECNPQPSTGQLSQAYFSYFNTSTNALLETNTINISEQYRLEKVSDEVCITGDQRKCYYYVVVYRQINKELAPLAGGYTIAYQRCCRISSMENINNSNAVGNTFSIQIPGSTAPFTAITNSSPSFPVNDTAVICQNNYFEIPFLATDPNSDSLAYELCAAYTGGSQANPAPTTSTSPPFAIVPYTSPFAGFQPLGAQVTINPRTGLISGIAPGIVRGTGEYVVCVCVREFRNGVQIAVTRKELHVKVATCEPIRAQLNPQYITCDGFTLSFSNQSPSSTITSHFWDFGVPGVTTDTSVEAAPTFTYPDTGTYTLRLVVNKNQQCTDSTSSLVKVYPGFFPGFTTAGICKGTPVQFTDTSSTRYGIVDSWRWNFGDPSTLADTSRQRNPTYSYTSPGTYTVTLTVTNSKGCSKTSTKEVTIIDQPTLAMAFRDSAYCGKDTLTLGAVASVPSTYSWTPLVNIIDPTTENPKVFPTTPTKYYVIADAGGCFARDSVTVNPRNDLAAIALATPAVICQDDTVTLSGSANHGPVTWEWSPAASVFNSTIQNTKASPQTNTTYTLTVRWGNNCIASDSKTVTVRPLAIPEAGPDVFICAGQSSAQLNASGGDNYIWTPSTGLSNPNIANPVASPTTTTVYQVSVGVNGCSRRRTDSVKVEAKPAPALAVTNDTLICVIDTLQLQASGTGNVFWTPNYNISDQTSQTPLVSPDVSTTYHVTLTDAFGCTTRDSVRVNVIPGVNLFAGNDTTICQTDAMQIMTVSDALRYEWSPAMGLNDSTLKRPTATPAATTTYTVTAYVGGCRAIDNITITTVPYPIANAGPDTAVCFGLTTQLNATGGDEYTWSPAAFLDNPKIANPVASPLSSMIYTVSVRSTTSGCPKPVRDTVKVTIYPKVIADAGPRDTVIVTNQRLQLNGTGGTNYTWSPGTGLNNAAVSNPIAILGNDMRYVLTAKSAEGCSGTDTIDIIVYKVEADLFVPTAFTPNGDRNNDFFRPIPIGMKAINYFKVFNRWGVLMFSSTEMKGKGWDGTFAGKPQDADTFVWIVQGVDYEDKTITKKGYVILIR